MLEGEEQDTCRICSAPAEPDQPLFHPCKCSGTIRYIHQDCLTTWLAHSKKKTCDVCKHPYAFTKVYAPDMPSHIPPLLLIRRLIQQLLFAILFVVRAIAVAVIWLAVLPWVTVWTWRMYFAMGESTAWWISNRPRPPKSETASLFTSKGRYEVVPPAGIRPALNFLERISTHPTWVSISADIFTGQIIAALIVLTFVAIFLLREWISQNARPGLFEDDELGGAEDAVNVPLPLPENNFVAPRPDPPDIEGFIEADLARQQQQAMRFMDDYRLQANRPPHHNGQQDEEEEEEGDGEVYMDAKGKAREDGETVKRARVETDLGEDSVLLERMNRPDYKRRVKIARHLAAKRRVVARRHETAAPALLPQTQPNFDFTFTAAGPSGSRHDDEDERPHKPAWFSDSQQRAFGGSSNKGGDGEENDDYSPSSSSIDPSASFFPHVEYERPKENIPFTIRSTHPPPETPGGSPQRPSFSFDSPSNASSGTSPRETGSPSLTTYRAPEDIQFDTGPSTSTSSPIPPFPQFGQFEDDGGETSSSTSIPSPQWPPPDLGNGHAEDLPEEDFGLPRMNELHPQKRAHGHEVTDSEDEDDEDETDEDFEAGGLFALRGASGAPMFFRQGELEEREGGRVHAHEDDDDDEEEEEEEDEERDHPHRHGIADEDDEDDEQAAQRFFADPDDERVQRAQVPAGNDEPPANWNAPGGEGAPELGGVVGPAPPVGGVGPQQQQDQAQGLDGNDEFDGNVEDDMEGAMEAIGMRGPIYGVLQNAALMVFVLDTAIGLCIWIPFTIGKTSALLSLDPPRMLQILHLPIKAMRLVTDPIVDTIVYIITRFVIPPPLRVVTGAINLSFMIVSPVVSKLFGVDAVDNMSQTSHNLYGHSVGFLNTTLHKFNVFSLADQAVQNSTTDVTSTHIFPEFAQPLESHFELLGRTVRLLGSDFAAAWTRWALGDGPAEKVFAVLLGYVVFGIFLAVYLNLLTVGTARTAGRAVRSAVRQQLLVTKVAGFIFIELVVFPLACGIILDVCTVWLFPEANIQSRLAFFGQAPLTAMFYHWVAGTMFMYSFAVLLSGCRSVMRPGAMWFIKDPQDQNSHPIRDILERPTLVQLRKICVSAIMYSVVVVCVVGSAAGLLVLGSKSIMPFRWKNREPLSNVPVDLLFLHLVLPQTLRYFRPRRAMKTLATRVWRTLAARLRLTSYFFGGRYPKEEYATKPWFKFPWSNDVKDERRSDGTFRRVPATDHLALPRDMKATAQVTVDGLPFDPEASQLITMQNVEAMKAKHDVAKDYMIVFIPSGFRYRIIAFIFLLWTVGALFVGVAVALPVQLGRSFFTLFTAREVHDGYSFIVGFYSLWACYLFGRAADRLEKQQRRVREAYGEGPRRDVRIMAVKRTLFWVSKMVYAAVFLGVVVPVLIAFVVDLYVVLPVRNLASPGGVPRIRIVDSWALGLLYAKIVVHVSRLQAPHRMTRGIQRIVTNGWLGFDPVVSTKEVIAPLIGGLLGMILFPSYVIQVVRLLFPKAVVDANFMFMNIYPVLFVLAALVRSSVVLYELLTTWSQSIRDTEFLVELRLKNHDPQVAKKESEVKESPDTRNEDRRQVQAQELEEAVEEEEQRELVDEVPPFVDEGWGPPDHEEGGEAGVEPEVREEPAFEARLGGSGGEELVEVNYE